MRLRSAAVAAAGTLTLLIALPTSAHAATGEFSYGYIGLTGVQRGTLENPPGGVCVTLPEVADPGASTPAFAPRNDTDAPAVVFTEPDCTGEKYSLRPHGGHASERLKLRSVSFRH